ncbi:hypothetical protein ABPG72_002985 [Tetrahymena utriculariae]
MKNQVRKHYHQNSDLQDNAQQEDDIFVNRNEARSPSNYAYNSPNRVYRKTVYRQRGTSYDNFIKEVNDLHGRNKKNQNILDKSLNLPDKEILSHRSSLNPNSKNLIRKLDFLPQSINGVDEKKSSLRAQSLDKNKLRSSHGNVQFQDNKQQQLIQQKQQYQQQYQHNTQTLPQENQLKDQYLDSYIDNINNKNYLEKRNSSCNSYYQQNSPRNYSDSYTPSHVPCFSLDYSFLDDISPNDPRLQRLLNDEVITNKTIDVAKLLDQNPDYFHHMFRNCACFQCTCGLCKCEHSNLKLTYKPGFKTNYRKDYNKKTFDNTPSINQTHYNSIGLHNPDDINPNLSTNYRSDYQPWKVNKQSPKRDTYKPSGNPFFALTTYNSNFKDWQNYDPTNKSLKPLDKHVFGLPFANTTTYKDNYNAKDLLNPLTARDIKAQLQGSSLLKGYQPQHSTEYNSNYIGKNPYDRSPNKNLSDKSRLPGIPSFPDQFKSTFMNDFDNKRRLNDCPVKTQKYATKPWKLKLLTKINQFRNSNQSSNQNYTQGEIKLNQLNYSNISYSPQKQN